MTISTLPPLPAVVARAAREPGMACVDVDVDPGGPSGHTWVTWAPDRLVTPTDDWPSVLDHLTREMCEDGVMVAIIGYEAGRFVERMPEPKGPSPLPDVVLRLHPGALVFDHAAQSWRTQGTERFRAAAARVLEEASTATLPPPQIACSPLPLNGPADQYRSAVASILRDISQGELYQANIAWQAHTTAPRSPVNTWLELRVANPAARGAFVDLGPLGCVLSNSPEVFLDVALSTDGTRSATSRPIKGTARTAGGTAAADHLLHSAKERAELTMIVDLVRNDLGRVARVGGVTTGPRTLRRCGDLLHAEQAVRAQLRSSVTTGQAIAACFPPGSVTGAPKVRAMSRIHALEAGPRGVYTGAIGLVHPSGAAHLSVAIRTVTVTPHGASFHLGAGIVADSEPDAEWDETLAKGRQLHVALQASQP